jgi:hypothetical protein
VEQEDRKIRKADVVAGSVVARSALENAPHSLARLRQKGRGVFLPLFLGKCEEVA